MRLNASILFQELKKKYLCEYHGKEVRELHLHRPEFYMDREALLLSNHLYLATVDHLPVRPVIEENAVLVCVGKGIHLNYYKEHCTLIIINEKANFFRLYQDIQGIFNRYDEWYDSLFDLFKKDADIQKILDASLPVFGRLISVMDADFHYLGISHGEKGTYSDIWNDAGYSVPAEQFGNFLSEGNFYTHIHEPVHLDFLGYNTLCVNLFDNNNGFIGCLMIDCGREPPAVWNDALAIYLGQMIEESLHRNGYLIANEHNTLKVLLKDLIDELPVSRQGQIFLRANGEQKRYVCTTLHSTAASTSVSIYSNYICNLFETNLPNSIAFTHKNLVVGFVELSHYTDADGAYLEKLNHVIQQLMETLQMAAGISDDFSDVENARQYYLQAEIAYKNGSICAPSSRYYYFSSYTLMELISNSLGGLPAGMYYPSGLKKLLEHDAVSNVSYLETLRVFLDENLNYNRAADALYVHRSTLTDRITRIERDLGLELSDPNERLRLMILLKAMEIDEIIKSQT